MRIIKNMCFQGDVCFRRLAELPADTAERAAPGEIVVAHSDTGHNHAIPAGQARLFEKLGRDPMVCYLQISDGYADVVHHRPTDTHETVRLPKGTWEVRRQREWTPEGLRRVED